MPLDLGRRLLASGAVLPGELRRALFEALTTDKPFARALADASVTVRALVERPLDEGEQPAIRAVVPNTELTAALPPGLPARLLVVPVRRDPRTGTIDVACVDPTDAHLTAEVAFHLGGAVRMIAAPLAEIERALLLIAPPKKDPLLRTADYEARPSTPSPTVPAPPTQTRVAPISKPEEDAVPLVRRSRASMHGPSIAPPRPAPSEPPDSAIPLSRTRVTLTPPTTAPFDRRPDSAPPVTPVQMVVDFREAARQERRESTAERPRRRLPAKRPPFPSLTPILEAIDVARDRGALIEALLRGLATTATAGALFAPRRGTFVGVGAIGEVDPERIRNAVLMPASAVADALSKNERLGTLDPIGDADLHGALGLERFTAVHVLIHPAFVADRAALLLVSLGMGDVLESSRRARVLATAASAALERLLRR